MNEKIYEAYVNKWIKGITSEYRYWDRYFATYKKDNIYNVRISKCPDVLDEEIMNINIKKVLDVGAGPVSLFGKMFKNSEIELTAIDPLADMYSNILNKYHITPYCRTEFCIGECISDFYDQNHFDLAYMRNAIDHTFSPIDVVLQILYVTKLNGNVVLFHRKKEAERREYGGFHQWNVDIKNNNLIFYNKEKSIDVNNVISNISDISIYKCRDGEYDAIKAILTKKHEFNKPKTTLNKFSKIIFAAFCRFSLEREFLRKKLAKLDSVG